MFRVQTAWMPGCYKHMHLLSHLHMLAAIALPLADLQRARCAMHQPRWCAGLINRHYRAVFLLREHAVVAALLPILPVMIA